MPDPDNLILPFPPVGEAESGQKLLRFLERRLDLPQNLLHRWLRTGQIRLNGRRCKPFEIVATGDVVRLPPFAQKLSLAADSAPPPLPAADSGLPPLLGVSGGIWAFNKPAGLAVQPGISHPESLSAQLADQYKDYAFRPAPGHRLDYGTSGVLLVGATFPALQQLQADFRAGKIHKEYLAWVEGAWQSGEPVNLRHFLAEDGRALAEPGQKRQECRCIARPVVRADKFSLLQILLLTGRKRQIRAQLAACGHPVAGDGRYGARLPATGLKLHSCRIILPDGSQFSCLPEWEGAMAVSELPPILEPEPKESANV